MAKASAKAVDFSGVKDRGNFNPKRVEEGDYPAVITKVEDAESKKDGAFQWVFTIKLKKFSQNSYPFYCKLSENQLWKVRNLALAAGINVPKKRLKLDPNRLVGKTIGVTMEDDEYEGKEKSTVASVFPVSELAEGLAPADDDDFEEGGDTPQLAGGDDDTAEDEAAASKKKGKKKGGKKAAEPESAKGKKKGKKKKGSGDDNVEDLDISDI